MGVQRVRRLGYIVYRLATSPHDKGRPPQLLDDVCACNVCLPPYQCVATLPICPWCQGQLVGCAGVTVDLAPEDVATAVSANVAGAEAAEAGAAADGGKGVPGGVPAAAAATGGTLGGALTTAGGGGVAGVALAAVATASAPAAATRAGERLRQGGRDSAKERKAAEGAEAAAGTQTADGGPVLQPGGDYGLLTGLAVHPACRRRGVASALLAAAAELVAERVAAPALLALLVARTNTGAVRWGPCLEGQGRALAPCLFRLP